MKRLIPFVVLPSLLLFCLGAQRAPASLPVEGLNGSGAGYCVTVQGSPHIIDVPQHALSVEARERYNRAMEADERSRGLEPGSRGRLSLDPGAIVADYADSVRNAFRLSARLSGDPALIEAAEGDLVFTDLGLTLKGSKAGITSEATCMRSSCYGMPPSCRVTGCVPGCADCVSVKVKSPKQ